MHSKPINSKDQPPCYLPVPTPHSFLNHNVPPMARSVDRRYFHDPRAETQSIPFAHSLPTPQLLTRRPSSAASSEGVDIEDLQLSLAHVGALASGTLLPPGGESYCPPPARQVTTTQKEWLISASKTPAYGTFVDEDAAIQDLEDCKESYESKYIGISPERFWRVFAVITLSYFVACFDSTLMASSHPIITSYFGASQAAPWLSTAFLITSTAFQPLFGRLSDTVGRKSVFLLSLAIFAVATGWCAVAGTIGSFIAARAVCGLGAGGTMSLSLIVLSDLVRIEHRGVFQSHINIAFGLGSASGAALGGWLCDNLGWRWAFGIQVPLICGCFIIAALYTPSHLGPVLMMTGDEAGGAWIALRDFDFFGSLSLVATVTSLILALNLGGNILPWSSPTVIACLLTFVVVGCAFVYAEKKAKQPLMPLHLLREAPIANMVFANLLGGIASNAVLFNLPLFFQAVLLTSASSSGLRLALPSLMGSLAGVATGYIITITRRLKPTLVVGVFIYLLGSIVVSCIDKDASELVTLILTTGVPLGQGFVFPSTMMGALAVSDQSNQAVVTTTMGLWRNLGIVLGIALSSLVFQNCLVVNLRNQVTGPHSDEVIRTVRSSVESIKFLETTVQKQVVAAYAVSLRTTFLCAIAASALMVILIVPVRLPRLHRAREMVLSVGE